MVSIFCETIISVAKIDLSVDLSDETIPETNEEAGAIFPEVSSMIMRLVRRTKKISPQDLQTIMFRKQMKRQKQMLSRKQMKWTYSLRQGKRTLKLAKTWRVLLQTSPITRR